MDVAGGNGRNPWVGIAVTAALFFDVISEACSSPQTAEINIGAREETLMKWVYLGVATGFVFVIVGIIASPKGHKREPLIGGGMAAVIIIAQYHHARKSGLAKLEQGLQGTETYENVPA